MILVSEKCAEQELQKSEQRFRLLVKEVKDYSIIMLDPEGRIITWNAGAEHIKGYRAEEIIGQHFSRFYTREAIEKGWPEYELAMATSAGRFEDEGWRVRKDGSLFWADVVITSLRDANGNLLGYSKITRDLTAQQKAKQELERARTLAEATSQAKSTFLANMSHEIRTPMNAIIGMTELLLDGELTPTQREYLAMVKDSGESLLSVINDILDFSKIEAGRFDLDHASFDLRESLGDTVKSLALRAHRKHLELACHVRPDVPEFVVGDRYRLRQIIVNLVGNAIKFTDVGEVVVDVSCDSRTDDTIVLHLVVRDTGIGIRPEKQQAVFEAFEQADESTTRRFGGTGLGLAISNRLVELMGGHIWVTSEVGAEASFTSPFDSGFPLVMSSESGPRRNTDSIACEYSWSMITRRIA